MNLSNDDFYDMIREFLTKDADSEERRPKPVTRVLSHLTEIAPHHARIIEQYILKLEKEKGAHHGDR